MNIRSPAVAGMFYPADKKELQEMIENFLANVKLPEVKKEIKAVIAPHAGLTYSGQAAAYGYKVLGDSSTKDTPLQRSILKRKNFILLGPSHRVGFNGVVQDAHDFWQTPLGISKLKTQNSKLIIDDSRPHMMEHSLEVQLPFLQVLFKDFTITPLLIGFNVDCGELASVLEKNLDENTFLIVSSDLSHYYSQDIAEKMDKKTIKAILNLDIEGLQKEECGACGKGGILTVVNLAKRLRWQPKLLFYDTSGSTSGDFSRVVGYASLAFYEKL